MPVTSTSRISSKSGRTSPSGVPAASSSARSMIPDVVGAELDLVLGEDHPLGHLAAELAPLERQARSAASRPASRPQRSRPRRSSTRRRRSGSARCSPMSTVVSWSRSAFGCFSAVSTLPTRKRPRFPPSSARRAARRARPRTSTSRAARRSPRRGHAGVGVFAQPAKRDFQNCSRKRRSSAQRSRMSGRPCRRIAIRSSPQPNAKPETSSGS